MKRTRRLLAMLLAFAMVFSLLPGNAAAIVRAAEDPDSGSTVYSTVPCFAEKTEDETVYVYFLQYPKKGYYGEDVEVRLMKYKYGEAKSTAEAADIAAFEEKGGKISWTVTGGYRFELEPNADKTAYVLHCDEFGKVSSDNSYWYASTRLNALSVSVKANTYYRYIDDYDNAEPDTWNMIDEDEELSYVFQLTWESPAELKTSVEPEFDLTNSYTATLTAPEVVFRNDIDGSNYRLQGNWHNTAGKIDDEHAIVSRDSGDVSYAVTVYKKYTDENGDEKEYSVGPLTLNYTDKTTYEYVKLGVKTDEEQNVTDTYYLRYQKAIYNGDNLNLRYIKVEGTDNPATAKPDEISIVNASNADWTLTKNDTKLGQGAGYYENQISIEADSFVEKKKDEDGNIIEYIYPEGEKTYTLTYDEGAMLDNDSINLTEPVQITLKWSLPGTFDVTENVKEQVYYPGEVLFTPEFTPDEERTNVTWYDTDYDWYYRDSKDAEWEEYPTTWWGCRPDQNGYYRCHLTVENGSGQIWETDQEYHVSKVEVRPVSFIDRYKSPQQHVTASELNASVGQNVTISPEVQVAKGYNIAYQWYKNDVVLSGKTEVALALSNIQEADYGIYILKATASLDSDTTKTPCYQATYQVEVVGDQPYTFDQASDTWSYADQRLSLELGVDETIDAEIPLVPDSGYTATYQWYQRVYQAVDDYYAVDETGTWNRYGKYKDYEYVKTEPETVTVTDAEGNESEKEKTIYILAKYEKMEGQTAAGLKNYKLTNADFIKTVQFKDTELDKTYTYTYTLSELGYNEKSNFKCEVKVADGNGDNAVTFSEYLYIHETYTFTELYSPNQSADSLQVDKGKDLTITAPDFEISSGYQVLYQWQQREKEENGDFKVDEDGQPVWKNLGEASTTNTYQIAQVDDAKAGIYRVVITPARKNSTAPLLNANWYEEDREYAVSTSDDQEVVIDQVFRTTDEKFNVKLGDKVTMGVEASVAKSSADCELTYQWYHNGEKLAGATKATYTIDKVDVLKFGAYKCVVTATSKVNSANSVSRNLTFTVSEETGITVTSPVADYNVVSGKKVGDKVKLQVAATADDTLTYSWYRLDNDTTSRTYGQNVKLETVTGAEYELTLTENDFTKYTCRISNTRGESEERVFAVVKDDLTDAVQPKNGVDTFDKKLGESVDLTVVSTAENLNGTFTYQWYKDRLKMAKETKDTLSLKDLTEDQFGTYRCDWTYVKDGVVLHDGSVAFDVVLMEDESTDVFERIEEYGQGDGRNRVGDTLEIGVKPVADNKNTYTYRWGFIEEAAYYDRGESSETLLKDKTTATLKLDQITEEQFGYYHLYIYDADGTLVTPRDEAGKVIDRSFWIRKYVNNGTLTLDNEETEIIATKAGQSVTLSVKAETTTSDPITYQWYKGKDAIYGATDAAYELKNLKEADFTTYYCEVTCGDQTARKCIRVDKTANLKLTHDILPSEIDGQYYYYYYYKKGIGQSVTFEVNATADEEIVYQWYKDGARIKGATSKSYTIDEISEADYEDYSCVVTAGSDSETVYFNLAAGDTFLSIVDKNADGEWEVKASTAKTEKNYPTTYTIYRTAAAGDKVTLAPEVRASEGYEVSYQWYHYDKIQKRYVKIDGATSATYEATVTEEDLDDEDNDYTNLDPDSDDYDGITGDQADYRCQITTSFGKVNYDVDFFAVTWTEYKGMSITATGVYPAPKGQYGYALEGATVSLKAAYTGDETDLTYQWYEADSDGNLRKVVGATGLEYSVKAPMVPRTQLGDGKEQQDMSYNNVYICAALKDGKIVDGEGYNVISIKVPDTLDELPKVSLARKIFYEENGYDVQGYRVPGAASLTFEFTGDRKLRPDGDTSTKLVIFDANGNYIEYPDADGNDIAGKTLRVNTDTAVFVYLTGFDDEDELIADALEGERFGYEVVLAKNTAVYDQEIAAAAAAQAAQIAAEQAKVAADEAEKAALKQQVQEALDTAKAAKQLAETGKTTTTATTTTTTTAAAKNPIKTVKVKKKTVTVKAGKTVTVTFNIAAKNKKAVTTDKAKTKLSGAASKGAKVTKTTLSKTTAKVKVKTNKNKKGTMKLKLTIGSKSATVKIKVK